MEKNKVITISRCNKFDRRKSRKIDCEQPIIIKINIPLENTRIILSIVR